MTTRRFISRFSPNRTDPEDLEEIHVQRHALLDETVELVRESARTKNKHHLLFVGPRGCGKTHLLSLLKHRLSRQDDLADRLRIAWLNEDETSTSFLELLVRIHRALGEAYPAEFPPEELEAVFGQEPARAREGIGAVLLERAGRHTILVLVENLDEMFRQLDETEQRAWRAFVQNHPVFATVGTARALFAGVADHDQPFFGFFDVRHLQPLSADEATELLHKIAGFQDDRELVGFLEQARGRARVLAVHHLVRGNHRLYVALSQLITAESFDQLVLPFEELVDEQLTPHYQERLRWLSPLQRRIVELLCQQGQPIPVRQIADRLFAAHTTISPQLKALREMGYVVGTPRGRESLYELAEPLMRLGMQVKGTTQAAPLGALVRFLRDWYEPGESARWPASSVSAAQLHDRRSEAMSAPSLALPSSEAPPATAVARDLVAEVYARFVSAQSPRPRAKEAVDLFAGEGALQRLGSALVRHLTQLALSPPTADGLRQWLDLWQSVAGEHAAMQLPMRLLRVGIEYLASQPRNPGKLLDLPAEERELLRQVLPLSA